MRTTLTIADDVLAAAKALAEQSGKTTGEVISDLVRQRLTDPGPAPQEDGAYGFVPFPKRGGVVTNELINSIRDEEGV